MTDQPRLLHLGVAIDGAGAHPAAWRLLGEPDAVGSALLQADTYVQRALRAEAALCDFVVLDDALVPGGEGPVALRARLDALLTLARVAPQTSRVGLVATVTTTHTEPFNVGKNVATLDWVSLGRAGWRPVVAGDEAEYAHFGRREPGSQDERWAEAADVVDVVARLADSWEDGAIIRDQPSGRYIDRDKVHYVDFQGPYFTVRGPSITPRSPQAQPLVMIDAGPDAAPDLVAARWADVIVIDAATVSQARARRTLLRGAVGDAGRHPDDVFVLVRVEVLLAVTDDAAAEELAALDGFEPWTARDGGLRLVGSTETVASALAAWARADATDGFVVLPARLPVDLDRFAQGAVPALGRAGVFRTAYEGTTLRDHFGLARPRNRYATGERGRS